MSKSIEPNQDGTPYHYEPDISLRDHFAAQVLPAAYNALMANRRVEDRDWANKIARNAYKVADAMLKARAEAELVAKQATELHPQ